MTYVIAEPCLDVRDKACIEVCPVDCIYEGGRMLYIHPDECVDCGACEPACPMNAIYSDETLPAPFTPFKQYSAQLFQDLGSLGGAAGHGPLAQDHPTVLGLAPAT